MTVYMPLVNTDTPTITLSHMAYRAFIRLTAYRETSQTGLIERLSRESYIRPEDNGLLIMYPTQSRTRSLTSVEVSPETEARLLAIGKEHLIYGTGPGRVVDAILTGRLTPVNTTLDQIARCPGIAKDQDLPGGGPYPFYLSIVAKTRLNTLAENIHPGRWLNRLAKSSTGTRLISPMRPLRRRSYKVMITRETCHWLAQQAELHDLRPHQSKTVLSLGGLALEALGQGCLEVL